MSTEHPLVESIYKTVSEGVKVDEEVTKEFGETLSAIIADRIKPREPRKFTLRMSNLGKGDRQLWFESKYGESDEFIPPHTYLKFLLGDIIESVVLFLAQAAGHKVTKQQAEVDVDGIKGHIDANIDGVTVDVKSASTYSFKKFKDGSLIENDPFGYFEQMAGYCKAENTDGAWLAMDKTTGHLTYLPVSKEDLASIRIEDRIEHIKQVVSSETMPARCYSDEPMGESGNRVLGINCSYCPWKKRCWQDSNGGIGLRTYIYSSGPKWFTNVQREPKGPHEITF